MIALIHWAGLPLLAELTGLEIAGVIGGLVFGGAGSLVGVIALFKKTSTRISPQPLNVEIVKAMHERFARQEDLAALVAANSENHLQIFRRLETVEREARAALGGEISKINLDRQRTMEKLNEQFTFIRESLAAINRELQLKRRD
jgi:hypothetical protein